MGGSVLGSWAEKRRDETARFIDFVCRLLEGARQRGELGTDIDLTRTAEALYSLYLGSLIRAVSDNRLNADALLRDSGAFVDQVLAGIGEPTGTGSVRP